MQCYKNKQERSKLEKLITEQERILNEHLRKNPLPNQDMFRYEGKRERIPLLSNIPVDAIEYAHKDWTSGVTKLDAWAKLKGVDTTNWYEVKVSKPRLVMNKENDGT